MKKYILANSEFVREAIESRIFQVYKNFGWRFESDEIESYFIDFILSIEIDESSTPSQIVDNAIINGEHGEFLNFLDNKTIQEYEHFFNSHKREQKKYGGNFNAYLYDQEKERFSGFLAVIESRAKDQNGRPLTYYAINNF